MKSKLRFRYQGDAAIGTLASGVEFVVDAKDAELVAQKSWTVNKDGYLSHHARSSGQNILLHRWLLGVTDSRVIVDHVNRDRMDYRRCNLRTVSPTQNSANHSFFQTNKTGYTGVYFSRHSGRYEVKVGYHRRRILLGSSKNDLITLAQMYNIGARFFFGEYAGALNDVPDPPNELIRQVTEKCQKYMEAPALAGASVA